MGLIDKAKDLLGIENAEKKANNNTPEEEQWVGKITNDQENAESIREGEEGIAQTWEDEYKILVGGGKQWETSFAYRSKRNKKIRPNSEDNFVFLAVQNLHANITANVPEVKVEGTGDDDDEVSEKLTYLCQFNDKRNNFRALWKKMVLQYLGYGPIIGGVLWDAEWTGGTGPDRWVGDVRLLNIDRREIFFDPAIINLEERLQECAFINRKFRKKLSWIKDRWPDKGKFVSSENNEDDLQDEGMDPQQAYVVESWHRGKPWTVPEKAKAKYLEQAAVAETMENNPYKAKDLQDMAKGILKGIHAAYVSNGVFLGYEPYVYDDGLYPFVYKTLYFDENTPFGFGEIRNIKIPQVMHNKADEIEIEAYSREGLGGGYFEEGGITPKQLDEIKKNSGKGGMWFKVQNIHKMKDRESVKTPTSLTNYKEHKQRMVETVSSNTPIQQGMAPGANVPYSTVAELGARTDIRTKQKIEVLEDFLIEFNRLRINRFRQFYTEDRYYRLKGKFGKKIEGTFNASEMERTWERETGKMETFVPEFDIDVKIMDEKPNDREYYTKTGFEMFKANGMTIEDLWTTIDEGEFPPKEQILDNLRARDEALALAEMMKQVPPEAKQQVMQMLQGAVQQTQGAGGDMDAFLDSLPDEALQVLQQMDPEQQGQHVQAMMQMDEAQLQQHMAEMLGGG
jgi:hypothetical protein